MPVIGGFPRTDWEGFYNKHEHLPEDEQIELLVKVLHTWCEKTVVHMGGGAALSETENFYFATDLDGRQRKLIEEYLEKALARILSVLDGIAQDTMPDRYFAIIFTDHDAYYRYISYFYPDEGDYPMSSGIFLRRLYPHLAMPFHNVDSTEGTIAHELTHACVSHLELPLWLDEGLATTMESALTGFPRLNLDHHQFRRHEKFWTEATVQEFWNGESFNRTDEGNELSYELARFCVKSLSQSPDEFRSFVNAANFEDGGEAAAFDAFGGSLGGLMHQYFGDGNWSPAPDTWDLFNEHYDAADEFGELADDDADDNDKEPPPVIHRWISPN